MPSTDPDAPSLPRPLRIGLNASGAVFVVSLVLVLLDVADVVRLPAPIRATLPWLWVAATWAGITLLVGALGTPKRTRTPDPPPDTPPG